jgi:hypothetical protein
MPVVGDESMNSYTRHNNLKRDVYRCGSTIISDRWVVILR